MIRNVTMGSGLLILLILCACNPDPDAPPEDTGGYKGSLHVEFDLVNSSETGDRGHWGVHAWIMKEGTYIDTLTYYERYSRYRDASNAAEEWLNDGGKVADGVSGATVLTDAQAEYANHYTLTWDCKNSNGTKVPAGLYTLKVVISRHTRTSPYGTLYTADIRISDAADQQSLEPQTAGADPTEFPCNILKNSLVEFKAE